MQMQARGSRMRPYWGSPHHHVQRANRASYPLDVYGIGYAQRGLWTLPHGLGCLSRAAEGGENPGHHSSIKQQRSALALTTHFGGRSTKSGAPLISGIRLARRAEHRQPNKIKCPRPTARPSVSWPVIGFDAKLLSNPPFDLPMGAQIGNERECICKLSLNGSVCVVSLKTMDIGHSL
ncbi:hypothetical protein FOIG_06644 [Fusarium odoratissimum NRRL 54006]|uniref:Uncharacterized protein n=1 Tax=Fusarium odoratissimum (strain NRRL 54006) TaxID=1089451 RepID=X0JMB9_FUSO5|nr:uncharacterized protein FOIG_06644 [Fusarium odoratissimum NRRL 54006]EXM02419.1 hypothetical protein FOIG_06644 [Fusarium odoratissimum NRRL 54006]